MGSDRRCYSRAFDVGPPNSIAGGDAVAGACHVGMHGTPSLTICVPVGLPCGNPFEASTSPGDGDIVQ
jgi:hypothetical protein